MNNHDINATIETLSEMSYVLETLYIENEGEITEETEQMEEQIGILKELLTSEGIDSLGRWLKGVEDSIKTLKAEKDYLTRTINAKTNTIDYIKAQMHRVLGVAGLTEIKGSNGYKFASTISRTTSVDKETLKEMYNEKVQKALEDVLPSDVTITLGASVSLVPEGQELPTYYKVTETPSCKFTKPRAKKGE